MNIYDNIDYYKHFGTLTNNIIRYDILVNTNHINKELLNYQQSPSIMHFYIYNDNNIVGASIPNDIVDYTDLQCSLLKMIVQIIYILQIIIWKIYF